MTINGKEVTLPQISVILGIISMLLSGSYIVHDYFAKSAEIDELKLTITKYKSTQKATILRLKQAAQLEVWTTEQTFIAIRKDTIMDRLAVETNKPNPDAFQIGRWNAQLDDHTARQSEIKTAKEELRLQMTFTIIEP